MDLTPDAADPPRPAIAGQGAADVFSLSDPVAAVEAAAQALSAVRAEAEKRVIGQRRVVELSIAAILAGGHALLVGAPGLAKTRLVETLGVALGLDAKRIQFTPDLTPPDILGAEVLEQGADGSRAFRFIKGPIFTRLLMADEINRASPRTQSALLQAMQEHHVTVAGERYDLPAPFHVLATQNPIEQEGAYPLPEAQLDRFLLQIDVDYPDRAAERAILDATTGLEDAEVTSVLDAEKLIAVQKLVRLTPIGDDVREAILTVVRACRPDAPESSDLAKQWVNWAPGPRAAQALDLLARAKALMDGQKACTDATYVRDLAEPVLKHRMALKYGSKEEGVTVESVIADALAQAGL